MAECSGGSACAYVCAGGDVCDADAGYAELAVLWVWAVLLWGVEDAREEGVKEPSLTLASYVFGAVLVALVVLSALELVGVLRMPE